MKIIHWVGVLAVSAALAGCSGQEWGRILKNTVAGTAESACRAASNCSTGIRRDPLAPRPTWHTGGALPNDAPTPVVRR